MDGMAWASYGMYTWDFSHVVFLCRYFSDYLFCVLMLSNNHYQILRFQIKISRIQGRHLNFSPILSCLYVYFLHHVPYFLLVSVSEMKNSYPSSILYMSFKQESGVDDNAKAFPCCTCCNWKLFRHYYIIRKLSLHVALVKQLLYCQK